MQSHPKENADVSKRRRNAALLAGAMGSEVSWAELPIKRKVGVTVAMLGIMALPFAFIFGWIWALFGGLAVAIGAWLTYRGVEVKDKSPWPPVSG